MLYTLMRILRKHITARVRNQFAKEHVYAMTFFAYGNSVFCLCFGSWTLARITHTHRAHGPTLFGVCKTTCTSVEGFVYRLDLPRIGDRLTGCRYGLQFYQNNGALVGHVTHHGFEVIAEADGWHFGGLMTNE